MEMEFEDQPENCIANILSFTTPRDACTLSLVSSTFKSASQSDVVWERFLPSDYRTIVPTPLCFPSKKDLYLYLSQNPILIDYGQKSFVLEKMYGKKCYMLSARSLFIVWGDTPQYWRWTSLPDSRFSEVAELVSVCWFEIKGRINSCMLSPETLYGAYLVYKQSATGSYGFQHHPVEVSIGIVGEDDTRNTVYLVAPIPFRPRRRCNVFPYRIRIVHPYRLRANIEVQAAPPPSLSMAPIPEPVSVSAPIPEPAPPPPPPPSVDPNLVGVEYPKKRADGWWEVEIGDFFNKGGDEKEVEMGVYEVKSNDWKTGILLQGIEISPIVLNPLNE